MFQFSRALVALLLIACATPCQALSFHFSFVNTANGSGTALVEGIISGLIDNATSPATSVVVTANPDGFGTGEYVGNPLGNQFTVSAGVITSFDFLSAGFANTAPDVECCSLLMEIDLAGDVIAQ